jgi:formiminotetrahydrofolate cyclodeaminase
VADRLADKSLRDLLSEFASPAPTPGGGSACAAASALGTALLMMAASLTHTRPASSDDRPALAAARLVLGEIQRQLIEAIDADSAAYGRVVAARTRPKATVADQAARAAAIEQALRGATEVPLNLMRLSAAALEQARPVAAHAHRAAESDVGVAITLLRAGFEGARLTVDANLSATIDASEVEAMRQECRQLSENAGAAAGEAKRLLGLG